VVASSETGTWGTTPAVVELTLRPHFYQTRTFQLLLVATLGLAAFAVHRGRVRLLEARERELARRVEEGIAQIKVLSGLLPICASCKDVRDDKGDWTELETSIEQRLNCHQGDRPAAAQTLANDTCHDDRSTGRRLRLGRVCLNEVHAGSRTRSASGVCPGWER
jgi:hypothetical protein